MADNLQILEKLRDIHLPQPISWWPLAWGWYVLILIGLISLLSLAAYILRRYRQGLAKREALRLLADYERQYQLEQNDSCMSAKISELLRRVALVYYPRHQVAGLKGEAWIEFLSSTSKNISFEPLKIALIELPYQKKGHNMNLHNLFLNARLWIKQRGKPCLN